MATLPTTHQYQTDLRTWLGTLSSGDFDVTLSPLLYNDAYFPTDADVYKTWSIFENLGRYLPSHSGIRASSSHFVLSNIEDTTIKMQPLLWMEPSSAAWYTAWVYGGNPYMNNNAIKRRVMVACCVDMVMLDAHHEAGNSQRSDFAGFNLAAWGYCYTLCNNIMTTDAKSAFLVGLQKFFDRIEGWGPTSINADMDLPAIIGMWYVGNLNDTSSVKLRAFNYANSLINKHFQKPGYIDHGGTYDGSYMGISFKHLVWAYHVTKYPFLRTVLEKSIRFKTAMLFPEPNGTTIISPSDFNTATAYGAANDQHWFNYRDVSCAMLIDEAKCLLFNGRDSGQSEPFGQLKTPTLMKADIADWVSKQITPHADPIQGLWMVANTDTPTTWVESHWWESPNMMLDNFRSSFYTEMVALDASISDLKKLPYKRSIDFVHNFGDEFLAFKFGDFGGVISCPPLSSWDASVNLPGFTGGAISAFWTEDTGMAILGKQKGYQGDVPDTFSTITDWAMNHVYGKTSSDKNFTSARNAIRTDLKVSAQGRKCGRLSIEGKFLETTAPLDAITTGMTYERIFDVDETGLTVQSIIYSDGEDNINEMWEVLPVYLRDSVDDVSDGTIRYHDAGVWTTLTTSEITTRRIAITRNNHSVIVEFKGKKRLKLGPLWTTTYQDDARIQPVHVRVVNGSGTLPDYTELSYKITGPYKELSRFELVSE